MYDVETHYRYVNKIKESKKLQEQIKNLENIAKMYKQKYEALKKEYDGLIKILQRNNIKLSRLK